MADIERRGEIAIGAWRFAPAEDELRMPGKRQKLEHRAARTLELLCRHRGSVVSREMILDAVWQGRAVSANSVAIVVSDLREALGDTARSPDYIETVAKRGYRLRADAAAESMPARKPRALIFAAVAVVLALAGVLAWRLSLPAPYRIAVAQVVDETGDARYAPLAKASSAVLLRAAESESGATVIEPGGKADLTVKATLIMWSGKPTLSMSATDSAGKVVWSAMSGGGEDVIPGDVSEGMRDLRKRIVKR